VAADADATKRAVVGRFLEMQGRGQWPRWVTAAMHDDAYQGLRTTCSSSKPSPGRSRARRHDGQEFFANRLQHGEWQKPAAAVAALDSERGGD
jgi:hypothetical protein